MTISISKYQLNEILSLSSSEGDKKIIFQGIEYDSRKITGGELFIALKGDSEHGHKYIENVLSKGASLVLAEDSKYQSLDPERVVVVSDTLKAFWDIAKWWRQTLDIPIIAVTGSFGKTTVKEIISSILLSKSRGSYSLKSYNNHVGVPYSLSKLSREHSWAVQEVGMNHKGEIDKLSEMVEPDIAIITGIGKAHLGHFKNLDEIADAKCEMIKHIKEKGTLIYNQDDQVLINGIKRASRHDIKSLSFSMKNSSDSKVSNFKSKGLEGISFDLDILGEKDNLEFKIPGIHNAYNIASAALAVKTLFLDFKLEDIKKSLLKFIAPQYRLNIHKLKDNSYLVNDSYNANPSSMNAMIEIAKSCQEINQSIAFIIGDMLELGEDSNNLHIEIAEKIVGLNPEYIIYRGEFSKIFEDKAREKQIKFFSVATAEAAGHTALKLDSDIIFIKASRGIALEKSAEIILRNIDEILV